MSTERALAGETAESPRIASARELLKLLVKAQKAQRLYEGKNAVSERLESELFSRFSRFLDEEGDLHLVVQEFFLLCENEVVYRGEDRNDSLAFLLFRDGVRRLSFHRGLTLGELRAFLGCLNRVAVLANDQDDLVTLLWEQELDAIHYFAVEELAESESYPRLQEQLASGESRTGGGGGDGSEPVSLDLEQPVSTVPVEACRLEDAEIEALQQELLNEERVSFHQIVSELALELTLLEDGEEEQREVRDNVIGIADRLVEDGDLLELLGLEEHLDGIATMVFGDVAPVERLAADLRAALAEPSRVDRVLERVDVLHVPRPEVLTAYLARLGPAVAASLVPWMGRLASPAYRRAVTNAVLVLDDSGGVLEEHLPVGPPPGEPPDALWHRQQVREVLHALSQHPVERALRPLEKMIAALDAQTRRESFVALSRYPEARVEELCLERLNDADAEIRQTALDTLVRRGKREHGRAILDRALSNERFDGLALGEKRRVFAAVAKLGGEANLASFRELLLVKENRWFTSSKTKQLAEAVAHGVRMVGTEPAIELLREGAQTGARFVRTACLKELETSGKALASS